MLNRQHVYLSSGLVIRRPDKQKTFQVTVSYETRQTLVTVRQFAGGDGYRLVNGEFVDDLPTRYRELDNLAELLTIENSNAAFHHNRTALREWQAALSFATT